MYEFLDFIFKCTYPVIMSFLLRGFNTDYALQKAKENVERNYAVVGVLEDLNTTLTVLEHYVPKFFKGAKDHYWSEYDFYYMLSYIENKNQLVML